MVKVQEQVGGEWYHYPGEIETIFELAESLPPNPVIVNIGTGLGTSSLAFHEARSDATIFTIDIESCEEAFDNWHGAGVRGRIIPIMGESEEIGRRWAIPIIDLLFVDGDHSPPGIRIDVKIWEPHVVPGGLLVFHDYGNPVTPYVKPTVDALMKGMERYLERGFIMAFRKSEAKL